MSNLKKILALALAMVMTLSVMATASAAKLGDFSDAETVNETYDVAVDLLTQVGVINGYEDGTFKPEGTVTRAEMAKMICYALLGKTQAEKLPASKQIFTDVPANHWAAKFIQYCYSQGIIAGRGNGTFDPQGNVTGYEAAKMILVAKGYTKAGAYEGTGWQVAVATDAMKDIFVGSETKTYNDAATREEAAFYIFNGFTTESVQYVSALDVHLGTNKYVLGQVGEPAKLNDVYGRPYLKYTLQDKSAVDYYAPVKTYTTAVTECQLVDDVTTGTSVTVANNSWYVNGAAVNGKTMSLYNTINTVGAQGQLTEVYKVGSNYEVVQIDTFLGKVTNVSNAWYDSNGHQVIAPKTEVEVYDRLTGTYPKFTTTEYTSFAKGTYVLVQGYIGRDNTDTATYNKYNLDVLTVTTPVAGTATVYHWPNIAVAEALTVDGAVKPMAVQYKLGYAGVQTTLNTKYNFFFDQYGNIIGSTTDPAAAGTYAFMTATAWKAGVLQTSYPVANMVNFDAEVLTEKVLYNTGWTDTADNTAAGTLGVTVSEDYLKNGAYYLNGNDANVFWTYTTNADGSLNVEMVNAQFEADVDLTQGVNYAFLAGENAHLAFDDSTKFVVITGTAAAPVYTSVVGYKNLTTMADADVYFVEGAIWQAGVVSDYVVVDARNATYPGATQTVVAIDRHEIYKDTTYTTYRVYTGATSMDITVKTGSEADAIIAGITVPTLLDLQYNADQKVWTVVNATAAIALTNVTSAGNGNIVDNSTVLYAVNPETNYYKISYIQSVGPNAGTEPYRVVSAGQLSEVDDTQTTAVYVFVKTGTTNTVTDVYYVNNAIFGA